MDQDARGKLIKQLIDQGKIEKAIQEYMNLADVHYRLAQLNVSCDTYNQALALAQQHSLGPDWVSKILKSIADINLQQLDWREALVVYEQLCSLTPEDDEIRYMVIDLNVRLGREDQAKTELENYLSHLYKNEMVDKAGAFLENLAKENEGNGTLFAKTRLAEHYQENSEKDKAINQWEKVAEKFVSTRDYEGAKEAIRAILILKPQNADQYRKALKKLG